MIQKINCINPQYLANPHQFDWDETRKGEIAQPDEPGAKRVTATCARCFYEMILWIRNVPTEPIYRGGKKIE